MDLLHRGKNHGGQSVCGRMAHWRPRLTGAPGHKLELDEFPQQRTTDAAEHGDGRAHGRSLLEYVGHRSDPHCFV